jgi:hypothetical protein
MKRLLFTLLCLGMLGTSGCYVDPGSVSTSVDVGIGAYSYTPLYYPHRDGWYHDWPYHRWPYRPYPYYYYGR